MGAFGRSWDLTKLTFGVINKDKELLLFPLIGAVLSIGWMAALIWPTIGVALSNDGSFEWGVIETVVTFVTYLGLAFFGTFTKFCVAYTAKVRFEGGDASFGESIKFTLGKVMLVLGWATIAATVGLIFKFLDQLAERLGGIGEIVINIFASLLGMAWSLLTLFVVPSMVYEGHGPVDALKESTEVFKATWGEALVKHFGLGLVSFVVYMAGGLVTVGLFQVMNEGALIWVPIGFAVLFFIGAGLLFAVADTVFNTALYAYAAKREVPQGWNEETLMGAFTPKAGGMMG